MLRKQLISNYGTVRIIGATLDTNSKKDSARVVPSWNSIRKYFRRRNFVLIILPAALSARARTRNFPFGPSASFSQGRTYRFIRE